MKKKLLLKDLLSHTRKIDDAIFYLEDMHSKKCLTKAADKEFKSWYYQTFGVKIKR